MIGSMNMSSHHQKKNSSGRWWLKTLIEVTPVFIALTVFLSYTTIKGVSAVKLVTPLTAVVGSVSLWVTILMGLIAGVGLLGMAWLIYVFTRAPISREGSDEDLD